jgi:hypothetical protein
MEKTVKVWFDAEADFLEVCFSDAPALTLETDDEAVMKRVDASGKRLGFSILGVSKRAGQKHPLEATDRNDYHQTKPNLRELLFSAACVQPPPRRGGVTENAAAGQN